MNATSTTKASSFNPGMKGISGGGGVAGGPPPYNSDFSPKSY